MHWNLHCTSKGRKLSPEIDQHLFELADLTFFLHPAGLGLAVAVRVAPALGADWAEVAACRMCGRTFFLKIRFFWSCSAAPANVSVHPNYCCTVLTLPFLNKWAGQSQRQVSSKSVQHLLCRFFRRHINLCCLHGKFPSQKKKILLCRTRSIALYRIFHHQDMCPSSLMI